MATRAVLPARARPAAGRALFAVVAVAAIVAPVAFSTRLEAVFVVPKLGVLWGLLAVALVVAACYALSGASALELRPVFVVDVAVLAFLSLTVLASIFSTNGTQSLYGERLQHQGLLTTLLYVAWFYVARTAVRSGEDLRRLLAVVAAGGALVAGYALVQKAGLDPVWEGFLPGGRVFSSIGQANALAAYLVLVLPIAAAFAFDSRRVVRVAALIATCTLLAAFVFAQSRGGYIGLVAVAAVLTLGWSRELRLRRRAIAWVAAGVAAAMVLLVVAGELDRLTSVTDSSARFHRDAWRVAAEIAWEHPLLGTGPETFPEVLPEYSHDVLPPERASALDAFRVESPHNVYLGLAAGSGIPALIAYLVALVGSLVVLVRARPAVGHSVRIALVAVIAGITGHAVTDAFMSPEVTSTWLAWTLLGASLGATRAASTSF